MIRRLLDSLPEHVKGTILLRVFGLTQVPMIFYCRPTVVALDGRHVVVKIPLNRRTRNHLKSMYFGALCVGAEATAGLMGLRWVDRRKAKVSLAFKDVKADFLKRPEGDVHFTCPDGEAIEAMVDRVLTSDKRENLAVNVIATVPSKSGDEPVAKFVVTLSLKRR